MAANGRIEIAWGDGDHVFNIAKFGQAFELEEKCGNIGVAEIFVRLREGRWRLNDVREVIRLGLIGGGMKPPEALALTKRYFDDRPWSESVPVALAVLMAAMIGVPDDRVGKDQADRAENEAPSTMKTDALSDPPSTASEPDLGSPPGKSMTSRRGNSRPASMATTPRKEQSQNPST